MKTSRITFAALVAAFASSGGIAIAQHMHHGPGEAHGDKPAVEMPADARAAFEAANAKMHKDMSIALTGDADVDFVRGMIPHHQGAVDMAKILLQYGKDPELRKLAEQIVKSQEAEISWMQSWLARKGEK